MFDKEIITALGDAGSVVIIAGLFYFLFNKFTKFTEKMQENHSQERKEWRESDNEEKEKTRIVIDNLSDAIRSANDNSLR